MKKIFRVMSSVCAAGMMAVSAFGMSGCTFWETWRDIKAGAATAAVTSLWTWYQFLNWISGSGAEEASQAKSKLEIVTETLYAGKKGSGESLWETVDYESEPAEVVQYKNEIGWLSEGYLLAEVEYSVSIEGLLKDSDYWLPLPMSENARKLLDVIIVEFFEPSGIDLPSIDGMNGYWYYYAHEHCFNQETMFPERWLCDISVDEFDFLPQWLDCTLAWYNTDTNRLYWYEGVM